jgi:hypothetical protein
MNKNEDSEGTWKGGISMPKQLWEKAEAKVKSLPGYASLSAYIAQLITIDLQKGIIDAHISEVISRLNKKTDNPDSRVKSKA